MKQSELNYIYNKKTIKVGNPMRYNLVLYLHKNSERLPSKKIGKNEKAIKYCYDGQHQDFWDNWQVKRDIEKKSAIIMLCLL